MSGDDVFRVVQRFETEGDDRVAAALMRMEHAASSAARAMTAIPGRTLGLASTIGGMGLGFIGVGLGVHALTERMWRANEAAENMGDTISGLLLASTNLATLPIEEGAKRADAAYLAIQDRVEKIALRVGEMPTEIVGAFQGIAPTMGGMHKSVDDVLQMTNRMAAAAKVYGAEQGEASRVIAKVLAGGEVKGGGAFGRELQSQLGKLKGVHDRVDAVTKALEKMGKPVEIVTEGVGDTIKRFEILFDSVLRGVGEPAFRAVGHSAQLLLNWLEKNKGIISDIAIVAADKLGKGFDHVVTAGARIAEVLEPAIASIYNVVMGVFEAVESSGILVRIWDELDATLTNIADLFAQIAVGEDNLIVQWLGAIFDGIGGMFQALIALVNTALSIVEGKFEDVPKVFMGAITGMARMGFAIIEPFVKLAESITHRALSFEFHNRIEDLDRWAASGHRVGRIHGTESVSEKLAKDLEKIHKRAEELRGGKDPTADLKKIFFDKGKVNINVGKIEIRQDFRDQDPDAVYVQFRRDLERMAEAQLQSTVGGNATVFGR